MTYCGVLCEQGDLGFTIDGLLHLEFKSRPLEEASAGEEKKHIDINEDLVLA